MHDIRVDQKLWDQSDELGQANRRRLDEARVYAVNLMSAPGAGKTTLLERTLERLPAGPRFAVIEGDIQGSADADRLERFGIPVRQVNTNGACHLDPRQVAAALDTIDLGAIDLLFIENVGNLVCPAEFDLGESDRVMLLSVTEGHDKPAKYPLMFRTGDGLDRWAAWLERRLAHAREHWDGVPHHHALGQGHGHGHDHDHDHDHAGDAPSGA
jgi:hydrogenase nickel incorporation protein HypB